MKFEQTALPDKQVFRDAFNAGYKRYVARFFGDNVAAGKEYQTGPVAIARLIFEHGGECRYAAVAACLAGPAVFSENPEQGLNEKLVDFSKEVQSLKSVIRDEFYNAVKRVSPDARLFFQASAILMLEQMANNVTSKKFTPEEQQKTYDDALKLYSTARGASDIYKLDTRFEIAVMKATMMLETPHLFAVQKKAASNQPAL